MQMRQRHICGNGDMQGQRICGGVAHLCVETDGGGTPQGEGAKSCIKAKTMCSIHGDEYDSTHNQT